MSALWEAKQKADRIGIETINSDDITLRFYLKGKVFYTEELDLNMIIEALDWCDTYR
jgi:hypothetical protein